MNWQMILWWICWFSDGWERHFCQCVSMNLRSIQHLTKTTCSKRCSIRNMWNMDILSPVQCHLTNSVMLSALQPSLSFEIVANWVFGGFCGYIPHIYSNGQWCIDRNEAKNPGFTQSHRMPNNTQSARDRAQSDCCKPYGNYWEVLAIECAVASNCTSCPVRAKQNTTHMVTEYRSWWQR
jgi:hypothetical protein